MRNHHRAPAIAIVITLSVFATFLTSAQAAAPNRRTIAMTGKGTVDGIVMNEGTSDLQLLGDDRLIRLLRKTAGGYRQATSQRDWPSYNGETNGSRYSAVPITKANVSRLPRWIFGLGNTSPLQGAPVVVDGVKYVTRANQCYALDAETGRQIWQYSRPLTKGLIGTRPAASR